MSSEKHGEKPCRRKSEVSSAMFVSGGLVGPKPRPTGVGDGQSVNIPIPHEGRLSRGVTQEGKPSRGWMCASNPVARKGEG